MDLERKLNDLEGDVYELRRTLELHAKSITELVRTMKDLRFELALLRERAELHS